MINRTLVRTKVVQTLFAYYNDPGKTPMAAKKDLLRSFSDTYSLYMMLLDFVNVLTRYAEEQQEEAKARAKVTHREYIPNRRFIDNKFAGQIFYNRTLRAYMEEQHLSWDAGMSAVQAVYKRLTESPFYKEYMSAPKAGYDDDKRVWRKILSDLVATDDSVEPALEEMEVALDTNHWTTDYDVVISYVVKTIKRFKENSAADEKLLPMFETEEELNFGTELLLKAIEHKDEYAKMVAQYLRNWDAGRLAYMDTIIMQVALAEILNFQDIALEVSLNEYLEIAKEYSGEKSHIFINGILDEILKNLEQGEMAHKTVNMHK